MNFGEGTGFGASTVSGLGGAASDLFSFGASGLRAKGNRLEAEQYERSAKYADLNAQFTETTTGIKLAQQQRQSFQQIGTIGADVAGAGLAESGSALDLLHQAHSQSALENAVLQQQGLITEEGYKVQAENYRSMAEAARLSADAQELGGVGSLVSAGLKLTPLLLA